MTDYKDRNGTIPLPAGQIPDLVTGIRADQIYLTTDTRLSIGIENTEDIIEDLDQALSQI